MRWRMATREERQLAWLWGVAAVSSLLLRPLWLALAPGLPSCPFRALTGLPCPTCGSTRAALAFFHLDLGAALAANPLVALAGLGFVAGGIAAPLWAVLRGPAIDLPAPLPRWLRGAIVLTLGLNWVWVLLRW